MNIEDILAPWTEDLQHAARLEGWDLWVFYPDTSPTVQVQRYDDPEEVPDGQYLPSDDVALAMVRCGTGEHHAVARKIIHDHFPAEWANMEKAYVAVYGSQIDGHVPFNKEQT